MRALPVGVVVGLVLASTACAANGPALPGAIVPGPITQTNAAMLEGAIEWSPERRLIWADFRGRPDARTDAVAATAYVITHEAGCEGDLFSFRVTTRFLPTRSWVKTSHLINRTSDRTLRHERTHFDLSEVQARRARQALAGLVSPCTLSDDERDRLVLPYLTADAKIQAQYDRETLHGIRLDRQGEWQDRIRTWLRELPR